MEWAGPLPKGPGFTQRCHRSQAASVTLADALGLGADLCHRWRQSSNQSYSARRVEAQRAAVVALKRHGIWGKCISEPSLPSSPLSLPRGALCEERPTPRPPLPLHSTDTFHRSITHTTLPSQPLPWAALMGPPTLSRHRGRRASTDGPGGQLGGKGKEVTQRRLHSVTGLVAQIGAGANKNKGRGWQILSRGQERATGGP